MSKTKWYNWVGDPIWDDYCKMAWIFILGPCVLLGLTILSVAVWSLL